MTTATWNTRLRHSDQATYNEWRDEFITKLGLMVAGGFLAADETNITPAAGARPGTSTEGGYAVYHLNDSLHGTAPIYIRFGFGTGSNAAGPRVQITVGTATNGSGVLSGIGTTIGTFNQAVSGTSQATDTGRISFACCVAGYLGIAWKLGTGSEDAFFMVCRTCDNTGAITATGAHVLISNSGGGSFNGYTTCQNLRYAATAVAYTNNTLATGGMFGFLPGSQISTLTGGNIQVAVAWMFTPTVTPHFGCCGVLEAELTQGNTISVAMVGTTARTYLAVSRQCGPFASGAPSTAATFPAIPKFAMLYE